MISKGTLTNRKGESKRKFNVRSRDFTCMTFGKCPYYN